MKNDLFLENQIIELIRDRNDRGMSLLYDHYNGALFGLCLKFTKDPDDAKEVLQASLIKAWQNIDSYDADKARLFTWLYQITRNQALDFLRKSQSKQQKEIQNDYSSVSIEEDSSLLYKEFKEQLNLKVTSLESQYQDVINCVFYKGMTHMEASEYLNIPLGTFKTRIRNALKKLLTTYSIIALLLWSYI